MTVSAEARLPGKAVWSLFKMTSWIKKNIERLEQLQGCVVKRWVAIEGAVRESDCNGRPQWHDESVPFLQLERLDIHLSTGEVISIITYQNNDRWGLCRDDRLDRLKLDPSTSNSVFRVRELDELPLDEIFSVEVLVDREGDISDLRLEIGDVRVRLKTGEVYEQYDGTLMISPRDESILVQVNGKMPGKDDERAVLTRGSDEASESKQEDIMSAEKRILRSLEQVEKGGHLRALAAAFRDEGMTKGEVYALFESFKLKHERDEDETKYDAILDTMDFISGWCKHSESLFDDEQ